MTTRAEVVAEAKQWIETPWRHQASVKGIAADCIGLIGGVGVSLGLPTFIAWARDPECRGYGRAPDATQLMAGVRKYLDPIPIAQAGLGDVLVLRWDLEPQHFGIVSGLSPMRMVHAFASARKVVENNIVGEWRAGKTWRSLIVSAWRYRGLVD